MTFTMALPAARKGVIAVPFRQRVVFREEGDDLRQQGLGVAEPPLLACNPV